MASQVSQASGDKIDYFDMLPEGCVADTVAHTTPLDACRLTAVAPSFRSIADSNAVWERFLPSDYLQLISRAVPAAHQTIHQILASSPKKKLFLFLSDHPLLIDDGTMVTSPFFVPLLIFSLIINFALLSRFKSKVFTLQILYVDSL